MRHHAHRMDARIGAAGAVQARSGREKSSKGLFDLLLHTQADFLHLPTGVTGTIIGNGELDFDFVHAMNVGKGERRGK